MTHEERLKWQREYRKKTGNRCTNKYEKTLNGFLVRKYRNMLSRITGVQWKKKHLYSGLTILPRENFYRWSIKSKKLKKLFIDWEKSNYSMKLCPSINRVNTNIGYEIGNMEWITHSENSRLGSISRHAKKKI